MLQAAQQLDDLADAGAVAASATVSATVADTVETAGAAAGLSRAAYVPGGRYGERKRISFRAAAITVAVHAGLLAGLLHLQYRSDKKEEPRLLTVNLTPDSPPPPPPEPEKRKATANSPIFAPTPPLDIPRPAPPIATSPDPVPDPVVVAPPPPAPAPPAPPAPPSTVESGDIGARMVSGRPPRYPIESRRKHEQGTVLLSLVVGIDGRVSSISIARSSGFSRLDEAALGAVRSWRWAPIMRNGAAVMVKGVVEIPFVLQG